MRLAGADAQRHALPARRRPAAAALAGLRHRARAALAHRVDPHPARGGARPPVRAGLAVDRARRARGHAAARPAGRGPAAAGPPGRAGRPGRHGRPGRAASTWARWPARWSRATPTPGSPVAVRTRRAGRGQPRHANGTAPRTVLAGGSGEPRPARPDAGQPDRQRGPLRQVVGHGRGQPVGRVGRAGRDRRRSRHTRGRPERAFDRFARLETPATGAATTPAARGWAWPSSARPPRPAAAPPAWSPPPARRPACARWCGSRLPANRMRAAGAWSIRRRQRAPAGRRTSPRCARTRRRQDRCALRRRRRRRRLRRLWHRSRLRLRELTDLHTVSRRAERRPKYTLSSAYIRHTADMQAHVGPHMILGQGAHMRSR